MISPSFLVGRCDHGVFGRRLVGATGVLLRGGNFFCMLWLVVMVVWWDRRNWWDGSAQSQTAGLTLLPHHDSPGLKHSFLPQCRNIVMDIAEPFYHKMFPQENHPWMTTWSALKIVSTRKIGKHVLSLFKTCAFRYQISQNMGFDITFCTGSGRRTPALQIAKNLYGAVASPVESQS